MMLHLSRMCRNVNRIVYNVRKNVSATTSLDVLIIDQTPAENLGHGRRRPNDGHVTVHWQSQGAVRRRGQGQGHVRPGGHSRQHRLRGQLQGRRHLRRQVASDGDAQLGERVWGVVYFRRHLAGSVYVA